MDTNDVQLDVEPVKISDDDYIWYLNTERDIVAYIFTYIHQCDAIEVQYFQRFLQNKCNDLYNQQIYRTLYMLENAIKYKIRRPETGLDELYQQVEVYTRRLGDGDTTLRFHVPCVRDLIHFIDTTRNIVSNFDFDRHEALYKIIREHMKYIEAKNEIEKQKNMEKRQLEKQKDMENRQLNQDTYSQQKPTCNIS